ncbi:3-oxoacyl-[acyl-carrier-protein] reductase (3-ketoacyl-acyl carrier protein reductase) [Durusdinium trenchii]|uniref:3-oxoacyl-[acyl-carrier-protein] reductase (3-ketoacyl-acyl carrier protein reductase) n=1 Tax=Durusdinium trenchii TaxID=1381693 RepID=A0ABP0R118_9DINO
MAASARVALVTGASKGIGQAIAIKLASEGWLSVINYHSDREGAEVTEKQIVDAGGECRIMPFDIADAKAVQSAVRTIRREIGTIDVLVNNAAYGFLKPLVRVRQEEAERSVAVNVLGLHYCTQAVVKSWSGGPSGSRIINITSAGAEKGFKDSSTYCASKASSIAFTKALAIELGWKGVTVNAVSPGCIETGALDRGGVDREFAISQTPLGRSGRPEEVAELVAFLASERVTHDSGRSRQMDAREVHYDQTVANFSALGSGDLHFVGYYENEDDTLVQSLENLNRLFGEQLAPNEGASILDIGCGTGGPAVSIGKKYGCRVTGVDLGATQIETAKQAAEQQGVADRVTFQLADGTNLPFETGTFDGVFLLGSASHGEDKAKLFAECARVTKENARLVLGDVVTAKSDWRSDRKLSLIRRVVDVFFDSPHLLTASEYERFISESGFNILDSKDMGPHVCRSAELWEQALTTDESRVIESLGKSQYKSMLRSVQIFGQAGAEGHFGAVVITAQKSQKS